MNSKGFLETPYRVALVRQTDIIWVAWKTSMSALAGLKGDLRTFTHARHQAQQNDIASSTRTRNYMTWESENGLHENKGSSYNDWLRRCRLGWSHAVRVLTCIYTCIEPTYIYVSRHNNKDLQRVISYLRRVLSDTWVGGVSYYNQCTCMGPNRSSHVYLFMVRNRHFPIAHTIASSTPYIYISQITWHFN